MLSVKYMIELMDDNLIVLNPGYQRNRVWKENKRNLNILTNKNIRFEFQIREKKNQIILQLPDDDFELSFIVQNIEDILEYRAENGSLGNINFFFLNAERGPAANLRHSGYKTLFGWE